MAVPDVFSIIFRSMKPLSLSFRCSLFSFFGGLSDGWLQQSILQVWYISCTFYEIELCLTGSSFGDKQNVIRVRRTKTAHMVVFCALLKHFVNQGYKIYAICKLCNFPLRKFIVYLPFSFKSKVCKKFQSETCCIIFIIFSIICRFVLAKCHIFAPKLNI